MMGFLLDTSLKLAVCIRATPLELPVDRGPFLDKVRGFSLVSKYSSLHAGGH